MIAALATSMMACSNGPDDRMEDRAARDTGPTTPEMSGDRDHMREPIDAVNPPEDAIPFDHEIIGDSTIAPVEGGTSSDLNSKRMDSEETGRNLDRTDRNTSGEGENGSGNARNEAGTNAGASSLPSSSPNTNEAVPANPDR